MDWLRSVNDAISYMEEHLLGNLAPEKVAAQVYLSCGHFQPAFSVLMGMTVGEYIRARRLSLAGQELAARGARVLDVALKYGYETPESFSKAFLRFHGVTPSQVKLYGAGLKSFHRLTVPAATWAVFRCVGAMPNAIQRMWEAIYSEWAPQADYELIPGYEIEYYTEGDPRSADYVSEIWLPVKV